MGIKMNAIRIARRNLENSYFYDKDVKFISGLDYAIASIWGRFSEDGCSSGSCGDVEELYEVYFFLPRQPRPNSFPIFIEGCLAEALGLIVGMEYVCDQIKEFNKGGMWLHRSYEYDAQLRELLLSEYPESGEYLRIVPVGRIGDKGDAYMAYRLPTRGEVEQLLNKEYIEPTEFNKLDPMTQITILYLRGVLKKDVVYSYYYDRSGVRLYFAVLSPSWFIQRFGSNNVMLTIRNKYRWMWYSDPDLCHEKRWVHYDEKDSNHVTVEYEFLDGPCYEGQADIRIEQFDPHLVRWFRAF